MLSQRANEGVPNCTMSMGENFALDRTQTFGRSIQKWATCYVWENKLIFTLVYHVNFASSIYQNHSWSNIRQSIIKRWRGIDCNVKELDKKKRWVAIRVKPVLVHTVDFKGYGLELNFRHFKLLTLQLSHGLPMLEGNCILFSYLAEQTREAAFPFFFWPFWLFLSFLIPLLRSKELHLRLLWYFFSHLFYEPSQGNTIVWVFFYLKKINLKFFSFCRKALY